MNTSYVKLFLCNINETLINGQISDASQSSMPALAYLLSPVRELSAFESLIFKIKYRFNRLMRRFRLFSCIDKRFVKWGPRVRLQEALSMNFVTQNTTIRIPRVLDVFTIEGAVYIIQERIKGPVLEDIWHKLSPKEQHSSMLQLKDCLDQLRALKPPHPERVQAVDGSGLIDDRVQRGIWGPFANHDDFHCRCLNHDVLRAHPDRYPRVQEALSKVYGKQYRTVFSHGDLGPHNILWNDGKIVIIDWERSGWFPEYWDFTKTYIARGYFTSWWKMFEEMVERYDDELELADRISEYFETV